MSQTWGVISDTHGKLDARVFPLFRGVAGILHAGDICGTEILEQLQSLGPVYAVYGNNDGPPLTDRLPRVGIWPMRPCTMAIAHS